MSYLKIQNVVFVALTLLFSFSFVLAQETTLVPCNGVDCRLCDLVALGQNILNFLVTITAFVAVLMMAYAGFLMVTAGGDEGQVTKAKGFFGAVAIGFIITLSAWLIIDTLMKGLLDKQKFGSWNAIECVSSPPLSGKKFDPPAANPGDPTGSQTTSNSTGGNQTTSGGTTGGSQTTSGASDSTGGSQTTSGSAGGGETTSGATSGGVFSPGGGEIGGSGVSGGSGASGDYSGESNDESDNDCWLWGLWC